MEETVKERTVTEEINTSSSGIVKTQCLWVQETSLQDMEKERC